MTLKPYATYEQIKRAHFNVTQIYFTGETFMVCSCGLRTTRAFELIGPGTVSPWICGFCVAEVLYPHLGPQYRRWMN